MKNTLRIILLFLLFPLGVFAQSDCPDAIMVCGNSDYTDLDATGFGTQEIDLSNACSSQEHNSLWLKILIKDGGTLGFNLIPEQINDLVVDFDFWIYGPNVNCDNLGTAIRCSTTNPGAAGLSYNLTGMNEAETDVAEGPGPDGTAYIHWMDVQDDEIYYLIIDRPHGASNFSMEWTGTATFHNIPQFLNPNNIPLGITKCDDDLVNDNVATFDLTVYETMFIGPQTDVELTYHTSLNDMTIGENPLDTPEAYHNTANPQTIYLRMTNTVTGCYDTHMFDIEVTPGAGDAPDITQCDAESDGVEQFDLTVNDAAIANGSTGAVVSYYTSQNNALMNTGEVGPLFENEIPFSNQQLWARMDRPDGCSDLVSFMVELISPPSFNTPGNLPPDILLCDTDGVKDGFTTFNLTSNEAAITGAQTNVIIDYFTSEANAENNIPIANPENFVNTINPQQLYIKLTSSTTGCYLIRPFTITVSSVTAGVPDNLTLCDDAESGIAQFDFAVNEGLLKNSQPNTLVTYYTSQDNAQNIVAPIGPLYSNVMPYLEETIWVRVEDVITGCFDITSFTIAIIPLPQLNNPDNTNLNVSQCDDDGVDDASDVFDLTLHETMFTGIQTGITYSYYADSADLANGTAIAVPQAYANIANPQTIYVVPFNTITGCYGKPGEFQIEIINPIVAGEPNDLWLCDTRNNGIQSFNLGPNNNLITGGDTSLTVSYYTNPVDAEESINPIGYFWQNTQPYTQETIWARVESTQGCMGHALIAFTLNIIPLPSFDFSLDTKDFTVDNNSISIDIDDADSYEFSLDGINYSDLSYYNGLEPGLYTLYIRSKDGCGSTEEDVALLNYPKFFTPNEDGINELWNVYYLHFFPDARVYIFDRYGKLIKSYLGKEPGWDGTYNGERLPATDYWFLLQFTDGRQVKSHFSLIR